MENFILYEELGKGCRSVVYKGRRKGYLNYVAIICADKAKRPEISNHVRLSHDLEHANIVCFYEWYETSNHLWLVVELCTGGSLESVIALDGSLSEDVVRRFGWDLVKGLKHIHEFGIILSDLTPAKIFLDGSGILKFGNFCLSKAEGETLEDMFTLLSSSEVADREEENMDNIENMRKRLQGSTTYCAPEVLQGSESNISSDLWALGCILHHMYTGKPPFCSNSDTELREMILHQEAPPPRQTSPPSQDFQSLLKGLLNKNPDKRMNWPELLDHPFWTQVKEEDHAKEEEEDGEDDENTITTICESGGCVNLRRTSACGLLPPGQRDSLLDSHSASTQQGYRMSKELISPNAINTATERPRDRETGCQESVKHVFSGTQKKSQGLHVVMGRDGSWEGKVKTGDDPELIGVQQVCQSFQQNKSFSTGNALELLPKSGVDEDNTEAIFLISSRANSRSCNASDSPYQKLALEAGTGPSFTNCVKGLLHTDSDLTVTPIIDNPKILKSTPVRFDSKTLCVPAYSVEKLESLNEEEWAALLSQLCSSLEDQGSSTCLPSSSATAIRSKLNLLCYLCCVVGNTLIANKLINSTLLLVLTQQLRQASNWDVRSKVLRVMGLLALHCSHLEEDSPVTEVCRHTNTHWVKF